MNIRPAGHRVLVRLKKVEEKSKGGILLTTDDNKSKHQKATQEAYVERLGSTAFKDFGDGHPWCNIGDQVIISKYSGEDRPNVETGDIYRIINDEDVLAIVEDA